METWLLILATLLLSLLLSLFLTPRNLPPGPTSVPILTGLSWLRKPFSEIEPIIRNLQARYGPIITLRIGSRPAIFIRSRTLAHQALIQNGAVFADRPPALATNKIISSNQHEISSALYGPTWRLLRRNLTSEILHPSRVKSYTGARKWVLNILTNRLTESQSSRGVKVVDHFQYAMFCLLVLMCFGDKLDEKQINQIEKVQRNLLLSFSRFNILNFWPWLTSKIMSSNQHNISSAVYGPTWSLLRRNLTSEILHPSHVKYYGGARKWVLDILANRLTESQAKSNVGVKVVDHFQYAMYSLLVLMCFGDKLDEEQIDQIKEVQRRLLLSINRFNILNFWPSITRFVLYKRWQEFFRLRKDQEDVLVPLIRARKEAKLNKGDDYVLSYVDTLWDLDLPDEKRKLTEEEIISLCSEFLDAGTDTTSTALQWIMANVVKYPTVQERLLAEIKSVVNEAEEEVKEDDLQKMPCLKAVILEGLRRHPPAHFVVPHSVTHDVFFDGHVVQKDGTVNFMVADMGWDPEVWEDPLDFKPGGEEGFDITRSREIKMMPFGVGRRICPGLGLAVLHLEYFVANLVWKFEWRGVEGEEVDFAEKQEFTMVMRNPLKANISE